MDDSKSCQLQSRLSHTWNSLLCVSKVPQISCSAFSPFKARTLYIQPLFSKSIMLTFTLCRHKEPGFWKWSHLVTGGVWVRCLRKHWGLEADLLLVNQTWCDQPPNSYLFISVSLYVLFSKRILEARVQCSVSFFSEHLFFFFHIIKNIHCKNFSTYRQLLLSHFSRVRLCDTP